jgi:diguanylate cyclase (GGDEF)-like protein
LNAKAGQPENREGILRELGGLFDLANSFRDRVDAMLATFLREEGRLHALPEHELNDPACETLNRLGLESLFAERLGNDPQSVPLISAMLLDIDRVSKLNQQWGPSAGDKTIAAFGRWLKSLVRQQRGFDRVSRFTGQSFLLFCGDTAASGAVHSAERIRQSIEAASFRIGQENVELTASSAVAEISAREPLPAFYERLNRTLAEAKKAGRNRTSVDEGDGPRVVGLSQYQVKGHVIEVADPA